jgi:hypothetical protein
LQGELTAIRKRTDEARAKADLNADSWKNMDNRIKELMASEVERRAAQNAFIDQVSWRNSPATAPIRNGRKFDTISTDADGRFTDQSLEEAIQSKRAQETYGELNKLDAAS